MTPYTTLETLTTFVGVVLILLLCYWAAIASRKLIEVLIATWKRGRMLRQPRTTVEDRRERLLKLIASTDREDR